MHIQWMSAEQLTPYANNPRNHKAAVDKVARSLAAFGFKQPIVVDAHHEIIVGHTRWLAAKQLKFAHVPVLVAEDLTPEQANAYRLADNRTHEEASWEMDKLAQEIAKLSNTEFDLALTGFDARELAALACVAETVNERQTALHDCPDPSLEPVSQIGDLWELERHRVLCGDSTDVSQVMTLMGETRADMVFTDPPYNVNYTGHTAQQLTIENDALSPEAFADLLNGSLASLHAATTPNVSVYLCYASVHQAVFEDALISNGFAIRNHLIWGKQHFAWGHGRYKFQHEPLFYAHKAHETDAWYGDKRQATLWLFDKPHANRWHPTMKPIALIEKALHNSSREGDHVLDIFGGSGSTLMACETTARQAFLMELDPRYVDAIVQRWQHFTGKNAQLRGSGASFEEIQATRIPR